MINSVSIVKILHFIISAPIGTDSKKANNPIYRGHRLFRSTQLWNFNFCIVRLFYGKGLIY